MSFFNPTVLDSVRVPLSILPKCGKCGLYKTCESPKMEPSGGGRKKILIVGEAPGKTEDEKGIQFAGKTGTRLKEELADLSVKMRKDCWMTNALICRPPDNDVKDEKRVVYCRPNLLKTVEDLKPDIVVLLGNRAVRSLIGHYWKEDTGGIFRWAGFQIPLQKINAWVCPTFHPSYVEREGNPVLDKRWIEHLEAAFTLKGKPWKNVPDYKNEVELIYDQKEAAKAIYTFHDSKMVAFDYETNMLKPDHPESEIVCCSLSDGRRTISFLWGVQTRRAMREFVRSEVIKVCSNVKFELRWSMIHLGTEVRGRHHCTMNTAHALDPRGGITGIKFQSFVHLGQESYNDHIAPYLRGAKDWGYEKNRVHQIDKEELLLYCGMDSLLEYHVAVKQRRILDEFRPNRDREPARRRT